MNTPYPTFKGNESAEVNRLGTGYKYRINSMGLRGPELDLSKPSMIVLGGSNVFGLENQEEDIYVSLLAKHFDLQLINLSRHAAAPDTCFRIFQDWADICTNVKKVYYFEPPPGRIELLVERHAEKFNPGIHGVNSRKSFMLEWYGSDYNTILNYQKNWLAIEYICAKKDWEFIGLKEEEIVCSVDHAPDGVHMGPKSHKKTFQKIVML